MSRAVVFSHSPSGWREFEQSAMVGDAMYREARGIASRANAEGSSNYYARHIADPGGRSNTLRAAAEVYTPQSTSEDSKDRRLLSVSYAYQVRGF